MAAKEIVKGFEKTQYSDIDNPYDVYKCVAQIVSDKKNTWGNLPSHSFVVRMEGKQLKVTYMSAEVGLPQKIRDVETTAEKAIQEYVKELKKEFKKRHKDALAVKEDKSQRGSSSEKVSLNERYYFRSWRVYSIDVSDVAE